MWQNKIKNILFGLPSKVKIGKKYVGPTEPVYIIAEVGINHNGDIEIAKKLIDVAVETGADAVKFQKRTTKEILTREGLEKPYNSPHAFAPTYGEHREKLEFGDREYRILRDYAKEKNIQFFASIWDTQSADFMDELNVDAYKVPSADVINIPLLEYVAKKDRPILLSTGMSSEEEIKEAVDAILRFNNRLILFHCLSLYPSPEEKINLRYMDKIIEKYKPLPVGYSGHEIDELATLAAVARGACIVERHLTLDKTMKGGDHAASLEPSQFKSLVDNIRRIERILGDGKKTIIEELKPLREKLAKSIATKVAIPAGTMITQEMLSIKGPGTGIKPSQIKDLCGRKAKIDLAEDVIIPKEALGWDKK